MPTRSADEREQDAIINQALEQRILVVDDEQEVASLIREILARDGFRVDAVPSAEAALERLQSCDYALILTDLNMPGLGGRGFYEHLLREQPANARRTAFVTGDTMSAQARGFLDGVGRPFIEKPIAPKDLRRLTREILSTEALP